MERVSLEESPGPVKDIVAAKNEASNSAPGDGIPNGGIVAWTQVVGSFFLFFNGWGIVSAFGIGSIQASLLLLVGVMTGPLHDYGHFRALILAGCFLEVLGMMILSICKTYWQIILAQGLVVGIGCGCIFIPSVAILPLYFSTRKGLANGIAASGSGLGGIIYPLIFRQLQPRIGFGWATRIIAFIILATSIVPLILMKMRSRPPAQKKGFDRSAWKEGPYSISVLSVFIGLLGLYTPLFYIGSYSIQEGIMSQGKAFYLLPILNTGSVFGRLLPSLLVDRIGSLNMYIPCTLVSAILAFAWIGIKSTGGLVVFCLLYGFMSGLFLTLPALIVVSLSPHLGVVGARMGMAFAVGALGLLIGQPVAGAIVKSGWVGLQAFTGITLLFSAIAMIIARLLKVSFRVAVKA